MKISGRIAGLFIIGVLLITALPTLAATPLPPSDWYAVTWVEADDTLHWINTNGEQASIPRPKLAGEISQAQTRLHISPNGRTLVVISPLNNGREGIGFFDLENGQFVQTHETQPNEVFLPAGNQPFTEFSGQFAIPLRDNITGEWRIIAFESATGDAIAQIYRTDAMVPQQMVSDTDWYPRIAQFNVDEALNVLEVRFQMITTQANMTSAAPSLIWRIPAGNTPQTVQADDLLYNPYAGFDINSITGEVVFAWFDLQIGSPQAVTSSNSISIDSGGDQIPVAAEANGSASRARWLKNGEWVGYYRLQGAFAPHWYIVMVGNPQDTLPISPNVADIYHTPDGLLARNTASWQLDYLNVLNEEGFAEPTGTTLFQPGGAFSVIYSTPMFTPFALPGVEAAAGNGLGAADDFQAPQIECAGAPPARLSVGSPARVTVTDGAPLNIRTGPGGNFIMSIAEGTVVDVIGGSECANGYIWWQVQFQNEGANVGGWAAEGDNEEYYLEPFDLQVAPPVQVVPTATSMPVRVVPTATNPPRVQPSNPPRAVICNASPDTRLAVGDPAHSVQADGTLAVYPEATAPIPTAQLATNVSVSIIGGPACSDTGIRRWEISTTVNGQTVIGWVAEGVGQTYFLAPGFARAR